MRTTEECYEYVLARCGELAAQRRKKRKMLLSAAVPVCGVIIAGSIAGLQNGKSNVNITSGDTSAVSSESREEISSQSTINNSVENPPKYDNKLNIGEVEIAENDAPTNLFFIPLQREMPRNEVLAHFGLSPELDLSGVVDDLHETEPRKSVLNPRGKHGFCLGYSEDENGVGSWGSMEELHNTKRFDNDEFVFENDDGTRCAVVFFSHEDRIHWLRSGLMCSVGDGMFSNEIFYSLPPSTVAGVEMRIAKRSIGGYYAEFNTGELSVGLSVKGLSEDEIISILEYLAEYTGASKAAVPNDVSVGEVEEPTEELIIN